MSSPLPETLKPDVAVIGAGPGGYVCAIRLAQQGKSVVVIEREALGGVCLNWGCIPSKALIYVAGLLDKIRHGEAMGLLADNPRIDFEKLMTWKNGVVKQLTGGIAHLFQAHQIQSLKGSAVFQSPSQLEVTTADGAITLLEPKAIVIATGSRPLALPHIPVDHQIILDSTDALSLPRIPEKMVVIGGGVIGLELGMLYHKLGSEIVVIEMADQLLPGVDPDLAQVLTRQIKRRQTPAPFQVFLNSKVTAVTTNPTTSQATLTIDTPKGVETLTADAVLMSVGRQPNPAGLGLDKAGAAIDAKGFTEVNSQRQTNQTHIYAIGDVTCSPLLAHKASKEGLVVADVIGGKPGIWDVRAMPSAIFTDPEIAMVGETEAQLKARGQSYRVGQFSLQASGRALTMGQTAGLIKILTDDKTDQILGVHIIGPEAAELIAEAALAMELGATAEDLALTVHTHPTLSEALMEAAEAVHGLAIHAPPVKRREPALKPG